MYKNFFADREKNQAKCSAFILYHLHQGGVYTKQSIKICNNNYDRENQLLVEKWLYLKSLIWQGDITHIGIICYATVGCDNEYYITSWCYVLLLPVCETKFCGAVRLTSINIHKKILKNPVFKSTIFFLDVY